MINVLSEKCIIQYFSALNVIDEIPLYFLFQFCCTLFSCYIAIRTQKYIACVFHNLYGRCIFNHYISLKYIFLFGYCLQDDILTEIAHSPEEINHIIAQNSFICKLHSSTVDLQLLKTEKLLITVGAIIQTVRLSWYIDLYQAQTMFLSLHDK